MRAAPDAQADACRHGRPLTTDCLDCLIDVEEKAFDDAVREVTRRSERVRALKALRATQGG